nr:immunoglobulin heavy chain junction region [Mus musculus]
CARPYYGCFDYW